MVPSLHRLSPQTAGPLFIQEDPLLPGSRISRQPAESKSSVLMVLVVSPPPDSFSAVHQTLFVCVFVCSGCSGVPNDHPQSDQEFVPTAGGNRCQYGEKIQVPRRGPPGVQDAAHQDLQEVKPEKDSSHTAGGGRTKLNTVLVSSCNFHIHIFCL